jgi:hypothetical protein
MALPDYLQLTDPTQNLAGFGLTPAIAPLLNPNPRRYYAWDGTPIGTGNDCAPITREPELSGLVVPEFLEQNRIRWGQDFALPLAVGTAMFSATGRVLPTAGWSLVAYMAPYPFALGLLGLAAVGSTMSYRSSRRGLDNLQVKLECVRYRWVKKGRARARRCEKWRRVFYG